MCLAPGISESVPSVFPTWKIYLHVGYPDHISNTGNC